MVERLPRECRELDLRAAGDGASVHLPRLFASAHLRPRHPPGLVSAARLRLVSWLSIALLACAVIVLVGAEWPRLDDRFGGQARRQRERARRKSTLKVVRTESEEFAASVERDLSRLPTIEPREENGRR